MASMVAWGTGGWRSRSSSVGSDVRAASMNVRADAASRTGMAAVSRRAAYPSTADETPGSSAAEAPCLDVVEGTDRAVAVVTDIDIALPYEARTPGCPTVEGAWRARARTRRSRSRRRRRRRDRRATGSGRSARRSWRPVTLVKLTGLSLRRSWPGAPTTSGPPPREKAARSNRPPPIVLMNSDEGVGTGVTVMPIWASWACTTSTKVTRVGVGPCKNRRFGTRTPPFANDPPGVAPV